MPKKRRTFLKRALTRLSQKRETNVFSQEADNFYARQMAGVKKILRNPFSRSYPIVIPIFLQSGKVFFLLPPALLIARKQLQCLFLFRNGKYA